MAVYTFKAVPAWGQVGQFARLGLQAGKSFPVTIPGGGAATVVQNGVTQAGFLLSDSNGLIPDWTTTDILSVDVDFGFAVLRINSVDAITAGGASASAAASSATDAANSATAAASSATDAANSASDAAATVAGKVDKGSLLIFAEDYGYTGDGTTDDKAALQAAIDAAPGTSSFGGTKILIPYGASGTVRLSGGLTVTKPGVTIEAAGGFTVMLKPDPGVTGTVLKFAIASSIVRGPSVRNLRISMNGSSANALTFEGAYDNCVIENVFTDGLTGASNGISFIPAAGASTSVSQTITAINCYVVGATGFTGHAWHLDTVQEMTLLSCKGLGGGEGSGTAFYLDDCRGVQFYGCSAATSLYGWDIATSTRPSVGITISAPTIEGCTNTIRALGTATNTIANLSMTNPRKQIATSIDAGPITLTYVLTSALETGTITVTVNAGCSGVHLLTEDMTKITDSGSRTSVIAWENAAAKLSFRAQTGISLYTGPNENAQIVNAGVNQTSLLLSVNNGTASLKRVEIGAADSGGTGYRTLRVLN